MHVFVRGLTDTRRFSRKTIIFHEEQLGRLQFSGVNDGIIWLLGRACIG